MGEKTSKAQGFLKNVPTINLVVGERNEHFKKKKLSTTYLKIIMGFHGLYVPYYPE